MTANNFGSKFLILLNADGLIAKVQQDMYKIVNDSEVLVLAVLRPTQMIEPDDMMDFSKKNTVSCE